MTAGEARALRATELLRQSHQLLAVQGGAHRSLKNERAELRLRIRRFLDSERKP
jgi:hypothetical protein